MAQKEAKGKCEGCYWFVPEPETEVNNNAPIRKIEQANFLGNVAKTGGSTFEKGSYGKCMATYMGKDGEEVSIGGIGKLSTQKCDETDDDGYALFRVG